MRNLMKLSSLHSINALQKISVRKLRTRKLEILATKNQNKNEPEENFQDYSRFFKQAHLIEKEVKIYMKFLLDELIKECGLNDSSVSLFSVDKNFIVTVDTKILKKIGFNADADNITKSLLNHLEPFPFVNEKSQGNYTTIKDLRDSVESQYLAWRLKTDLNLIKNILDHLAPYLVESRSLKNMKRNLDVINLIPQAKNQSVANKIYLINMIPFKVENVITFEKTFMGYEWDSAVNQFPKLMKFPYQYVKFVINVLQAKGFTENQIKKALPVLKCNIYNFLKRLNYLMNVSPFSMYKKRENFLLLLNFQEKILSKANVHDFSYLVLSAGSTVGRGFRHKDVIYELEKKFHLTQENLDILQRHPKIYLSPEQQISQTLNYLKNLNFTNEEIRESITIVLHSKSEISRALKRIKQEEKNLSKIGFEKGCISENVEIIAKGTKLKNKTLQLCLYYIQKEKENASSSEMPVFSLK